MSIKEVDNWYPDKFSDKIDMILLKLSQLSRYIGDDISISSSEIASLLFIIKISEPNFSVLSENTQIKFLLGHLSSVSYITYTVNTSKLAQYKIQLRSNGWQRIDELEKTNENNKNVFVAMSFDDDMKIVRENIKRGIEYAGYLSVIMDEVEHNRQIVPEMLHEIRNAKFVVAELTKHNNGAYFEAGYALGLGKEVIHLCKKDNFGKGAHFDVKQVNTILWEKEEDIAELLKKRINATIK